MALLYEASVGGGIPLIRPLREHLAGDRIVRFMGIVNGTTNYILTRMTEDELPLAEALAEAQRLGFAEADPTADVEGFDAAAKAAILATIAFDVAVAADQVHREGIGRVRPEDIATARRLGYVVKLLAIAEALDGRVYVRVHPAMLPASHPLASVRESFNAVYVEGEKVGPLMLYGRGAGGDPTAVSVVGDIIELAGSRGARIAAPIPDGRVRPTPGPSAPSRTSTASTTCRCGSPTGRASWPPSPWCSPTTRSRSARSGRRGGARRPSWSSSPTARRSARSRPACGICGSVDAVDEVSSVIRVVAAEA